VVLGELAGRLAMALYQITLEVGGCVACIRRQETTAKMDDNRADYFGVALTFLFFVAQPSNWSHDGYFPIILFQA